MEMEEQYTELHGFLLGIFQAEDRVVMSLLAALENT